MISAAPTRPSLKSLLLLSGLYDLAPLGLTPLGKLLGLDDNARAARLDPLARHRPAGLAIAHALGGLEAEGFSVQAGKIEQAWNVERGFIIPDANHFSLLDGLKSGPLLEFALKLAR